MATARSRHEDPADRSADQRMALRERAEEEAAGTAAENLETLSAEEARRLLHDLRVHQIELEMQNEELRRAQNELEASWARYFDLYDLAPVGYFTVSNAGLILEANLRAATLLAVPRGELIRQPLTRSIFPEDQDIYYRHRRQLLATREPQACELRMVRHDGTPFWARLESTVDQETEGQTLAWRTTMSDITEHKRLEERLSLSQRTESVGRLAGGIAHDFNNLLTPIVGYAHLLQSKASGEERVMLNCIVQASEAASDLTRQLLAYAGMGQAILRPVDVSLGLTEMRELLRASMSRNVELKLSGAEHPAPVTADPGQIKQIVMNLVLNGVDAIGDEAPGSVTVAVRPREVPASALKDELSGDFLPAGRYVSIEVADTGSGINPEIREHIFDPFFTTKFAGRGLGLAAVAGITKSLKGGILIDTASGAGTTFRVLLPASEMPAEPPPPLSIPATAVAGTLLVVDDEPMVLSFLSRVLREYGYKVLLAENGTEAIRIFDENANTLNGVLLDLTMPGLSGKQTLEELLKRRTDLKVLLMSGYSESEALRLTGDHRQVTFVQKPFPLAKLIEKVKSAFQD